jgi:hypothetical protein
MVQLVSQRVKTLHQRQTPHRMNNDKIIAFVALQNLANLEKIRGVCSEVYPAFSCDAHQAGTIKAEVFSNAKEEEYPVQITFPGIKAESEVSCVSVTWISQIKRTVIPCFTNFVTTNNLVL